MGWAYPRRGPGAVEMLGHLCHPTGSNQSGRGDQAPAPGLARNQMIELPYYLNLALVNGVKPSESTGGALILRGEGCGRIAGAT
jgi:hypothetical protein